MINNEEFIERLNKIINHYSESASSFAKKIDTQRSSISHILSGRNKPSLDFILKILSTYPEVDLYWLLNGKGKFPKTEPTLFTKTDTITERIKTIPETNSKEKEKEKIIERIVIFYSDGSFKNFENK